MLNSIKYCPSAKFSNTTDKIHQLPMLLVLSFQNMGVVMALFICCQRLNDEHRMLNDAEVAQKILELSDSKIDGPLLHRLGDGTLRLMRY